MKLLSHHYYNLEAPGERVHPVHYLARKKDGHLVVDGHCKGSPYRTVPRDWIKERAAA